MALRKNVNKLLHTYLIKLLTPYWSKIDKALNVQEYHDDASPLHVRDADGEILERMPLASLLLEKIQQKTFKGPVVHNRNFERHIKGFKGPKDASDTALTTIIAESDASLGPLKPLMWRSKFLLWTTGPLNVFCLILSMRRETRGMRSIMSSSASRT